MTHADINDLETRDYIFKIGDRGKGIQARYDENTDTLIFPRAAFDYVCELLKEALSQEPCDVISRDALITKLEKLIKTSRSTIEIKAKLIPMIQNMPSVTQKSGKWIVDAPHYICSECNYVHHLQRLEVMSGCKLGNYCPNCGAKMERSDKE